MLEAQSGSSTDALDRTSPLLQSNVYHIQSMHVSK